MSKYKQKFNPLSGEFNYVTDIRLQYYDATVGQGGDYPATDVNNGLEKAIADGKQYIKLVSDINLFSSVNVPNRLFINLNGYKLTCNDTGFNIPANSYFQIFNGEIVFYRTTAESKLFSANFGINTPNFVASDLIIRNNSTIDRALISDVGTFYRCNFYFPNKNYSGFGTSFSNIDIRLYDCTLVGNNTGFGTIYHSGNPQIRPVIRDLEITGTWRNDLIIVMGYGVFENILATTGSTYTIYAAGNISYFRYLYGQPTVRIGGEGRNIKAYNILYQTNAKLINCESTNNISYYSSILDNVVIDSCTAKNINLIGKNNVITNCRQITGNVTINGDNNTITNNVILGRTELRPGVRNNVITNFGQITGNVTINGDNNTITNNIILGRTELRPGVRNNILTNNHFTGGLLNNSSNSTNIIDNNII